MKTFLFIVLTILAFEGLSFIISAGLIWVVAWAFGFAFSWKLAIGLWIIWSIALGLFRSAKPDK